MYSWHLDSLIVDVGPEWPTDMSPIARHVSQQFEIAPYQEGIDNDEEIAQNLEGLTRGIPKYA